MTKQEQIEQLNVLIESAEIEPYDSAEETEGFVTALEIALGFAEQLDEPKPTITKQDIIAAMKQTDERYLDATYEQYAEAVLEVAGERPTELPTCKVKYSNEFADEVFRFECFNCHKLFPNYTVERNKKYPTLLDWQNTTEQPKFCPNCGRKIDKSHI